MRTYPDAHAALLALEPTSKVECQRLLGPDVDCDAAAKTFDWLRDSLRGDNRVESALQRTLDRVRSQWPAPSPERRAGLLLVMAARGTARAHTPLGFDPSLLAALAA